MPIIVIDWTQFFEMTPGEVNYAKIEKAEDRRIGS